MFIVDDEISCVMMDDPGIALATDKVHHSSVSLRKYNPIIGSEQLRETIKFLCYKFVTRTIHEPVICRKEFRGITGQTTFRIG
jgi:hypothetical protein